MNIKLLGGMPKAVYVVITTIIVLGESILAFMTMSLGIYLFTLDKGLYWIIWGIIWYLIAFFSAIMFTIFYKKADWRPKQEISDTDYFAVNYNYPD